MMQNSLQMALVKSTNIVSVLLPVKSRIGEISTKHCQGNQWPVGSAAAARAAMGSAAEQKPLERYAKKLLRHNSLPWNLVSLWGGTFIVSPR